MTAFAALTLPNNAAVDQTFTPVGIDPQGVAKWLGSETILDGKKSVTMSVALPKNGSTVVRVKQRVTIPVMDAVDTTKKIAEAYADVVMVLPKQATETNRLDLRRYTEKLLENAVSTAAVTNFEAIY
jgi:hypothetical protein